MSLLKYVPFQLCICLIFGIAIGFYLNIDRSVIVLLTSGIFVLLTISYFFSNKQLKPSYSFSILSFLLFFCIGIQSISFRKGNFQKNHYTKFSANETMVVKVRSVLNPTNYYYRYEANVIQVGTNRSKGKILLRVKKDSLFEGLNVDTRLIVRAPLAEIAAVKNPYQFDYKLYLKKQNILHQISISAGAFLKESKGSSTLKGFAYKFRKRVIKNLMASGFNGDELAIINSLLLGERQEISKELKENYTKAGAIHILAISGLHVGIITLFLGLILRPLHRLKHGKTISVIIIVVLLWVFAFIAGLSASVVRAVTMFSAITFAVLGNRQKNVYHALIFSLFILLLIYPFYVFDVGFQLSYAAVFSIVSFQPIIEKIYQPNFKIIHYFWKLLTVSLAAQLGVLPLSLYYFHQFPGLFFLSNIIIIPILGFILSFGLIIILLSFTGLWHKAIVIVYDYIIYSMNQCISWIATKEAFILENIYFSIFLLIASYVFILTAYVFLRKKSYKNLVYVLSSFILLQALFLYEKWYNSKASKSIIFNQSRSTLIAKHSGQSVIFYSNDSIKSADYVMTAFMQHNMIKSYKRKKEIPPTLLVEHNLLVVDSLGIYNTKNLSPKNILLIQSPKINLDRLIEKHNPELIIADNSNYRSYVNLWEKTCKKHAISFYYTNKSGAFSLENK